MCNKPVIEECITIYNKEWLWRKGWGGMVGEEWWRRNGGGIVAEELLGSNGWGEMFGSEWLKRSGVRGMVRNK